ncbi:MarR family transcriptional regulator [Polaromonas sp. P1(28)-8]|nr:MarR family transcriptional regulator [Polaromonas sp. P1(28)-8]
MKKPSPNSNESKVDSIPLPNLIDQVAASVEEDKSLDGSALWVLLAIYRVFAVLDRDQNQELAEIGLTPLQFNILTTMHRTRQPVTMGALATMLVVRPTNLSGNINALVERGFVRRELNVSDQRSLLAVITDEGEEFMANHLPAHWRRLERLMSGIPHEQRLNLVGNLKDLVISVEEEQKKSFIEHEATSAAGPSGKSAKAPDLRKYSTQA